MRIGVALVLFDFTSPLSVIEAVRIVNELRELRPTMPIIVAGNKIDSMEKKVWETHIASSRLKEKANEYFEISAIANFNLLKMFTVLLSLHTG